MLEEGYADALHDGVGARGAACVLEAEHLVAVVLGPSWQPAVPLIRVLAPAMFLRPLADARPLFVALGRADLVLKVSLVGMGITIPALLLTAPFDLCIIWKSI